MNPNELTPTQKERQVECLEEHAIAFGRTVAELQEKLETMQVLIQRKDAALRQVLEKYIAELHARDAAVETSPIVSDTRSAINLTTDDVIAPDQGELLWDSVEHANRGFASVLRLESDNAELKAKLSESLEKIEWSRHMQEAAQERADGRAKDQLEFYQLFEKQKWDIVQFEKLLTEARGLAEDWHKRYLKSEEQVKALERRLEELLQ